jgi:hypothetical protein
VLIVPPSAAERFDNLLSWLSKAAVQRAYLGHLSLPGLVVALILERLRGIKQRFARVADLIREGKFVRRRSSPRRSTAARPPRPPDKRRPKFGWVAPLVPEAASCRTRLRNLLLDPEMAALIEAAPSSLGRPLRSLCWMVGLRPPPILAPPRRPRPPRPEKPPAEQPATPQPPPSKRLPPEVLARWPHASPLLSRAGLKRWRDPKPA